MGMLEIQSIAKGMIVMDAMVKKAHSEILWSGAVSTGKFLILIHGGVAEVEESLTEGERVAGDKLIDRLFLPQAHPQLFLGVRGKNPISEISSIGIVETHTAASALLSGDASLKAAEVWLLLIHLCKGIAGKGYYVLSGELFEIEASISAAKNILPPQMLLQTEIIPRPHEDFISQILSIREKGVVSLI